MTKETLDAAIEDAPRIVIIGGGGHGLHVQRLFQHHHVQCVRRFGSGQVGGGADDAVGEGDIHGDSLVGWFCIGSFAPG